MTEKVPMTPTGFRQLQDYILKLSGPTRSAAVVALQEARSHGDLSENAEYEIAKDTLSQLDKQIGDLQQDLTKAQIIDPGGIQEDKIVFGATVTLRDLKNNEQVTYQIVGRHEANIDEQKISIESPIARGLIGREEGDEAKVKTPKGLREFEILEISYVG